VPPFKHECLGSSLLGVALDGNFLLRIHTTTLEIRGMIRAPLSCGAMAILCLWAVFCLTARPRPSIPSCKPMVDVFSFPVLAFSLEGQGEGGGGGGGGEGHWSQWVTGNLYCSRGHHNHNHNHNQLGCSGMHHTFTIVPIISSGGVPPRFDLGTPTLKRRASVTATRSSSDSVYGYDICSTEITFGR